LQLKRVEAIDSENFRKLIQSPATRLLLFPGTQLLPPLFHDLDRSALTVTRRRTGKERPNRLDSLAVAPNDAPDIALPQSKAKHNCPARWNLRDNRFIRKIHELTDDKLKEFAHAAKLCCRSSASRHLLIFFDQAPDRIRWLGAAREPMFDPIQFQGAVVTWLFWIIGPDKLEKFSVARTAAVSHHYFIIRAIERAFSAESN
jgi:hypothetical protein